MNDESLTEQTDSSELQQSPDDDKPIRRPRRILFRKPTQKRTKKKKKRRPAKPVDRNKYSSNKTVITNIIKLQDRINRAFDKLAKQYGTPHANTNKQKMQKLALENKTLKNEIETLKAELEKLK